MNLFNNRTFRWFAAGFVAGASLTALAKATDKVKDLKLESASGRFVFKGASAWVVTGTVVGLLGGLVGLGTGSLAALARKSLQCTK